MGLARILEVCGPAYFQAPHLLRVFESVRMTLVGPSCPTFRPSLRPL